MSTDEDFTAYVGTHWSALVRVALLLDGADRAEALVQDALVRSYPGWARVWRDDRAHVDVLTRLLDGIHGPQGRTWRGENAGSSPASGAPDDDGSDLERALRPLAPLHRDVLVLVHVAELDHLQAADVLDVHPDTVRDRLREALDAVEPDRLRDDLR